MRRKLQPLSNLQIDEFFKHNKHYLGCFSKDVVPKNFSKMKNNFFIINLADDNDEGTHWTSLYIKPDSCLYFDSFGGPPPEAILKLMKATGKPCFYSDIDLQCMNCDSCGYWCVYVMNEMSRNRKFLDILYDDFTDDTNHNENILSKIFK